MNRKKHLAFCDNKQGTHHWLGQFNQVDGCFFRISRWTNLFTVGHENDILIALFTVYKMTETFEFSVSLIVAAHSHT